MSEHVLAVLAGDRPVDAPAPTLDDAPLGDEDHALALYCLHELSYRGFAGVPDELEWDLGLVGLRLALEEAMLDRLREAVPYEQPELPVPDALRSLIDDGDEGRSMAGWLRDHGDHVHLQEQAVLRSAYQRKEADPHSFGLPRLDGEAKAALVQIQFDEYGEGVQRDSHNELFALHLERMGLDATYGAYLDVVPGHTLATTNLVSLFGLHRRWRGALVGHLALFEMASVPVMANLATALRRLGYDDWTCLFYDVHVVADAEHQTVAAEELAGGLVRAEPALAGDVLWGARCLGHLEGVLTDVVLDAWEAGESALLRPVEARPAPGIHEPRGAADDPRLVRDGRGTPATDRARHDGAA